MQNGSTKFFAAGIVALLLAGCDRDNVKVYHVVNGQDETQTQIAPATNSSGQMLPPGHPDISGMDAAAPAENQNANPANSIWTIPADWKALPASEFLLAKFSIAGSNGANAQVNVAQLNGDGGGLLANVTRWRGQLGLQPNTVSHGESMALIQGTGWLVDMTGTNMQTVQPARLVGVIVPRNGETWFYKLMGDEKIVAQQKDAFLKFVQSAKYPDAR